MTKKAAAMAAAAVLLICASGNVFARQSFGETVNQGLEELGSKSVKAFKSGIAADAEVSRQEHLASTELFDKAKDSVVSVDMVIRSADADSFIRPEAPSPEASQRRPMSPSDLIKEFHGVSDRSIGSGFIIGVMDDRGRGRLGVSGPGRAIIATNAHVAVEIVKNKGNGAADSPDVFARVVMADNKSFFDCDVAALDTRHDIAFLATRESRGSWPLADLDDGEVKVGEFVMAVGTPLGLRGTATFGHVSALNRELPGNTGPIFGLIQIDAAVNPGNSGGPLFNHKGRVVGMNTAIETPNRGGGFSGIAFAIPSAHIKEAWKRYQNQGRMALGSGRAGLVLRSAKHGGVEIVGIDPAGPSRAELQVEDVIVGVDDQDCLKSESIDPLSNVKSLQGYIAARDPGSAVVFHVYRKTGSENDLHWEKKDVRVVLGAIPDASSALRSPEGEPTEP